MTMRPRIAHRLRKEPKLARRQSVALGRETLIHSISSETVDKVRRGWPGKRVVEYVLQQLFRYERREQHVLKANEKGELGLLGKHDFSLLITH